MWNRAAAWSISAAQAEAALRGARVLRARAPQGALPAPGLVQSACVAAADPYRRGRAGPDDPDGPAARAGLAIAADPEPAGVPVDDASAGHRSGIRMLQIRGNSAAGSCW